MLEEWRSRWENRYKLTYRTTEKSIRKWIEKNQPTTKNVIYYDWHPKDGFVAYVLRDKEDFK